MATTQSTALKHWARIIKQWPVDKVRPNSVSFQTVMQKRLSAASSPSAAATSVKGNEALVSADPPAQDGSQQTPQINALYSLLDNRFAKQYPLSDDVRHPASNPTHYDDLIRELEEAPSRSWIAALVKRVKGSLRFS